MTSYVQDGGHEVISLRKMLLWSLSMVNAHAASTWRICSSVRQLLIQFTVNSYLLSYMTYSN